MSLTERTGSFVSVADTMEFFVNLVGATGFLASLAETKDYFMLWKIKKV